MRRVIVYPTAEQMHERVTPGRALVPSDRFAKGHVEDANGCWRWIKGITGTGYGHFSIAHIYYQAHRIAYILHRGPVPADLFLDHLCRNRACVNPWHLEIVTHAENVRRGIGTRLTPELADAIRAAVAAGTSQRKVAPLFGVDHSTVSRICAGRRWIEPRREVAA
jgi:hypothetical protein